MNLQTDVALFPGTTYEMLSQHYWLDRIGDTDRVLMNNLEIEEFNKKNREIIGSDARLYDLSILGNTLDKEDLISIICEMKLDEGPLFLCGREISYEERDKIMSNRNLDNVQKENKICYGICTQRADIRIMPTPLSLNETPEDVVTDVLQSSAILLNEPVAVLYESMDQNWYFIRCRYYDGWVQKRCIALFEDYCEFKKAIQMEQFLVVTGNRLVLPVDPFCPEVSMIQLTMGIRLEIDDSVKDDFNNYPVRIPVRDEKGLAHFITASIPVSSDVNIGYLNYTTTNVLKLAFQTLGDLYGWGGSYQSRDCSSLPFELFRCFGFQLPRDSANLAKIIDCISYTNLDYHNAEERMDILRQVRPGAIVGWPGHTMIYIGNVNGKYYVINYAGHLSMEQRSGKKVRYPVHICLVNDLDAYRDNGRTWLESLTYIKSLENIGR